MEQFVIANFTVFYFQIPGDACDDESKKLGSQRLTTQLNAILSAIEILPLEEPSDHRYGELRADLEKQGVSIGPNDMLIAAHAPMLDCIVVTANQREFSRISSLKVENWLYY